MDKKDEIAMLFRDTQLTMQQIADHTGTTYKIVHGVVYKRFSAAFRKQRKVLNYRRSKLGELNPMTGKRGEEHHNFKGVVGDNKGYLMVLKPDWYTARKNSKHVFLHHVVWCEAEGVTEVPKGHCIHHCDKNPHNNAIDNLLLMTMAEHTRWHQSKEGATTISKESTAKWLEAQRAVNPS